MGCSLELRKCIYNIFKFGGYHQLSFQSSSSNNFSKAVVPRCRGVRLFSWRVNASGGHETPRNNRLLVKLSALTGTVGLAGYLAYKKISLTPVICADKDLDISNIKPSRSVSSLHMTQCLYSDVDHLMKLHLIISDCK